MERHFGPHRLWFKAIAFIVASLFLFNDIASSIDLTQLKDIKHTLSVPSRTEPIVDFNTGSPILEEPQKARVEEAFQSKFSFRALMHLVGGTLENRKQRGKTLKASLLKRYISRYGSHIDVDRFKIDRLYIEENYVYVPYIPEQGEEQLLKFYLEEKEPTPSLFRTTIKIADGLWVACEATKGPTVTLRFPVSLREEILAEITRSGDTLNGAGPRTYRGPAPLSVSPEDSSIFKPDVVVIGGGSSMRGIVTLFHTKADRVKGIFSSFDDGGCSGLLRREIGAYTQKRFGKYIDLPIWGDQTSGLVNLASDDKRFILNFQFSPNKESAGIHKLIESLALSVVMGGINHPPNYRDFITELHNLARILEIYFISKNVFTLEGHTLRNLIYLACLVKSGAYIPETGELVESKFSQAQELYKDLLGVRNVDIIPLTLDSAALMAKTASGTEIIGQSAITNREAQTHADKIVELSFKGDVKPQASSESIKAIEEAKEAVIIGYGSFYTSIIPNLMIPGIVEALSKRKDIPRILIFPPVNTEEDAYHSFLDLIEAIERYAGRSLGEFIDYVVVNDSENMPEDVRKEVRKLFRGKGHALRSAKEVIRLEKKDFLAVEAKGVTIIKRTFTELIPIQGSERGFKKETAVGYNNEKIWELVQAVSIVPDWLSPYEKYRFIRALLDKLEYLDNKAIIEIVRELIPRYENVYKNQIRERLRDHDFNFEFVEAPEYLVGKLISEACQIYALKKVKERLPENPRILILGVSRELEAVHHLWPDAKVTGINRDKREVRRLKEVASGLGMEEAKTTFIKGDYKSLDKIQGIEKEYDLILLLHPTRLIGELRDIAVDHKITEGLINHSGSNTRTIIMPSEEQLNKSRLFKKCIDQAGFERAKVRTLLLNPTGNYFSQAVDMALIGGVKNLKQLRDELQRCAGIAERFSSLIGESAQTLVERFWSKVTSSLPKVAIFSDIHGNISRFNAKIAELRRDGAKIILNSDIFGQDTFDDKENTWERVIGHTKEEIARWETVKDVPLLDKASEFIPVMGDDEIIFLLAMMGDADAAGALLKSMRMGKFFNSLGITEKNFRNAKQIYDLTQEIGCGTAKEEDKLLYPSHKIVRNLYWWMRKNLRLYYYNAELKVFVTRNTIPFNVNLTATGKPLIRTMLEWQQKIRELTPEGLFKTVDPKAAIFRELFCRLDTKDLDIQEQPAPAALVMGREPNTWVDRYEHRDDSGVLHIERIAELRGIKISVCNGMRRESRAFSFFFSNKNRDSVKASEPMIIDSSGVRIGEDYLIDKDRYQKMLRETFEEDIRLSLEARLIEELAREDDSNLDERVSAWIDSIKEQGKGNDSITLYDSGLLIFLYLAIEAALLYFNLPLIGILFRFSILAFILWRNGIYNRFVIPTAAGIYKILQIPAFERITRPNWIPAFAGMTYEAEDMHVLFATGGSSGGGERKTLLEVLKRSIEESPNTRGTQKRISGFLFVSAFKTNELDNFTTYLRTSGNKEAVVRALLEIYQSKNFKRRRGARYVLDRLAIEVPIELTLKDAENTYQHIAEEIEDKSYKEKNFEAEISNLCKLIDELGEKGILLNEGKNVIMFLDKTSKDIASIFAPGNISNRAGTGLKRVIDAIIIAYRKIDQYQKEIEEYKYERIKIYLKSYESILDRAFGKGTAQKIVDRFKRDEIKIIGDTPEEIERHFRNELFYFIALVVFEKERPWFFELVDETAETSISEVNEIVYNILQEKGEALEARHMEDRLIKFAEKILFKKSKFKGSVQNRISAFLRLAKGEDMTLEVVRDLAARLLADSNLSPAGGVSRFREGTLGKCILVPGTFSMPGAAKSSFAEQRSDEAIPKEEKALVKIHHKCWIDGSGGKRLEEKEEQGSGVIFAEDKERYFLLTAAHITNPFGFTREDFTSELVITLNNGQTVQGNVIGEGRMGWPDLALVYFEKKNILDGSLMVLPLASYKALGRIKGQKVRIFGHAAKDPAHSIQSEGIVEALEMYSFQTGGAPPQEHRLFIEAKTPAGFSGGPILFEDRIVGVVGGLSPPEKTTGISIVTIIESLNLWLKNISDETIKQVLESALSKIQDVSPTDSIRAPVQEAAPKRDIARQERQPAKKGRWDSFKAWLSRRLPKNWFKGFGLPLSILFAAIIANSPAGPDPAITILRGGKQGIGSDEFEKIALVDKNGKSLGIAKRKSKVHRDADWHQTAHIYIFDSKGKMLLQKRSPLKSTSGGKLQVSASGHINGGETVIEGALREGREELGIEFDQRRLIQVSETNEIKRSYSIEGGWNNEFTTVFFYQIAEEELTRIKDNYNLNETEEMWLIPVEVLRKMVRDDPRKFSNSIQYIINVREDLFESLVARTRDSERPPAATGKVSTLRRWWNIFKGWFSTGKCFGGFGLPLSIPLAFALLGSGGESDGESLQKKLERLRNIALTGEPQEQKKAVDEIIRISKIGQTALSVFEYIDLREISVNKRVPKPSRIELQNRIFEIARYTARKKTSDRAEEAILAGSGFEDFEIETLVEIFLSGLFDNEDRRILRPGTGASANFAKALENKVGSLNIEEILWLRGKMDLFTEDTLGRFNQMLLNGVRERIATRLGTLSLTGTESEAAAVDMLINFSKEYPRESQRALLGLSVNKKLNSLCRVRLQRHVVDVYKKEAAEGALSIPFAKFDLEGLVHANHERFQLERVRPLLERKLKTVSLDEINVLAEEVKKEYAEAIIKRYFEKDNFNWEMISKNLGMTKDILSRCVVRSKELLEMRNKKIKSLRTKEKSPKEIAEAFGVDISTIYRWIRFDIDGITVDPVETDIKNKLSNYSGAAFVLNALLLAGAFSKVEKITVFLNQFETKANLENKTLIIKVGKKLIINELIQEISKALGKAPDCLRGLSSDQKRTLHSEFGFKVQSNGTVPGVVTKARGNNLGKIGLIVLLLLSAPFLTGAKGGSYALYIAAVASIISMLLLYRLVIYRLLLKFSKEQSPNRRSPLEELRVRIGDENWMHAGVSIVRGFKEAFGDRYDEGITVYLDAIPETWGFQAVEARILPSRLRAVFSDVNDRIEALKILGRTKNNHIIRRADDILRKYVLRAGPKDRLKALSVICELIDEDPSILEETSNTGEPNRNYIERRSPQEDLFNADNRGLHADSRGYLRTSVSDLRESALTNAPTPKLSGYDIKWIGRDGRPIGRNGKSIVPDYQWDIEARRGIDSEEPFEIFIGAAEDLLRRDNGAFLIDILDKRLGTGIKEDDISDVEITHIQIGKDALIFILEIKLKDEREISFVLNVAKNETKNIVIQNYGKYLSFIWSAFQEHNKTHPGKLHNPAPHTYGMGKGHYKGSKVDTELSILVVEHLRDIIEINPWINDEQEDVLGINVNGTFNGTIHKDRSREIKLQVLETLLLIHRLTDHGIYDFQMSAGDIVVQPMYLVAVRDMKATNLAAYIDYLLSLEDGHYFESHLMVGPRGIRPAIRATPKKLFPDRSLIEEAIRRVEATLLTAELSTGDIEKAPEPKPKVTDIATSGKGLTDEEVDAVIAPFFVGGKRPPLLKDVDPTVYSAIWRTFLQRFNTTYKYELSEDPPRIKKVNPADVIKDPNTRIYLLDIQDEKGKPKEGILIQGLDKYCFAHWGRHSDDKGAPRVNIYLSRKTYERYRRMDLVAKSGFTRQRGMMFICGMILEEILKEGFTRGENLGESDKQEARNHIVKKILPSVVGASSEAGEFNALYEDYARVVKDMFRREKDRQAAGIIPSDLPEDKKKPKDSQAALLSYLTQGTPKAKFRITPTLEKDKTVSQEAKERAQEARTNLKGILEAIKKDLSFPGIDRLITLLENSWPDSVFYADDLLFEYPDETSYHPLSYYVEHEGKGVVFLNSCFRRAHDAMLSDLKKMEELLADPDPLIRAALKGLEIGDSTAKREQYNNVLRLFELRYILREMRRNLIGKSNILHSKIDEEATILAFEVFIYRKLKQILNILDIDEAVFSEKLKKQGFTTADITPLRKLSDPRLRRAHALAVFDLPTQDEKDTNDKRIVQEFYHRLFRDRLGKGFDETGAALKLDFAKVALLLRCKTDSGPRRPKLPPLQINPYLLPIAIGVLVIGLVVYVGYKIYSHSKAKRHRGREELSNLPTEIRPRVTRRMRPQEERPLGTKTERLDAIPFEVRPDDVTQRISEQPTLPLRDPEQVLSASRQAIKIGRYTVLQELGEGGMGKVYLVWDDELKRKVALKTLKGSSLLSSDIGLIERLRREAATLATLKHPNIIAIHEVGKASGIPFFVMDYIEGEALNKTIKAIDSEIVSTEIADRQINRAVEIIVTIAEALEHAHNVNVIHRDIKPSNIIIDRKGIPYIMDFGLAKNIAIDETLTTTGEAMGTPAYMSPEQAFGEGVDKRSDIYSLGATLYEMLTLQPPYKGPAGPVMRDVMNPNKEPAAPSSINPNVSGALEAVIQMAMAKDAEKRYKSSKEFAEDLGRYLRGESTIARPMTTAQKFMKLVNRNRALTIVILIAILAVSSAGMAGLHYKRIGDEKARLAQIAAQKAEEARREAKRISDEVDRRVKDASPLVSKADARLKVLEQSADKIPPSQYRADLQGMLTLLDEAAGIYEQEPQYPLPPTCAIAYFLRGRVYHKLGQDGPALSNYQKAYELNEKLMEAYFYSGEIYETRRDRENASKMYQRMLEIDPTSDLGRLAQAGIYKLEGRFQEALALLDELIREFEWFSQAYVQRANIQSGIENGVYGNTTPYENLGQSLEDYKRYLELNPKDDIIWTRIGWVYSRMGRFQEAEAAYAKMLALRPDERARFLADRAEFYMHAAENSQDQTKQAWLDKAERDWVEACSLSPQDTRLLRDTARFYQARKNFEKAGEYLKRAIQIAPKDMVLIENLMGVYLQQVEKTFEDGDLQTFNRCLDGFLETLKLVIIATPPERLLQVVDNWVRGKAIEGLRMDVPKVARAPITAQLAQKLPDFYRDFYNIGRQKLEEGNFEASEDYLIHAAVIGEYLDLPGLRAEVTGKYSDLAELRDVYYTLGKVYSQQGNTEKAKEYFVKAVEAGFGVTVTNVDVASQAEEWGIKKGDTIIEVNGTGISTKRELGAKINSLNEGGETYQLRIKIIRDGQIKTIEVERARRGEWGISGHDTPKKAKEHKDDPGGQDRRKKRTSYIPKGLPRQAVYRASIGSDQELPLTSAVLGIFILLGSLWPKRSKGKYGDDRVTINIADNVPEEIVLDKEARLFEHIVREIKKDIELNNQSKIEINIKMEQGHLVVEITDGSGSLMFDNLKNVLRNQAQEKKVIDWGDGSLMVGISREFAERIARRREERKIIAPEGIEDFIREKRKTAKSGEETQDTRLPVDEIAQSFVDIINIQSIEGRSKGKVLIGIDTSWLPKKDGVQPLLSAITSLSEPLGLDNILIAIGKDAETLAQDMKRVQGMQKGQAVQINPSNIVIVGSQATVGSVLFNDIRGEKGACFVGIDPTKLNLLYETGKIKDTRMLEMIELALELAFLGVDYSNKDMVEKRIAVLKNLFPQLKILEYDPTRPKTFMVIPDAEEVDIEEQNRINRIRAQVVSFA